MLGIDGKRGVRVQVRSGPGVDDLSRLQIDDADLVLVADVHVKTMMQVIHAHALHVVAGNGNRPDEFALVDGEDGDLRVGQIGGNSAVAYVVQAIWGVIVSCVRRIAFAGGGAIDQLNSIHAVKVFARKKDERRIATVGHHQLIFFRSKRYGVRRLESADAL